MKNKNIALLCTILLLFNICLFSTISYAANDSYSVTLVPDKTTIKAGDTISVAVKISDINIQTGEKGIGSYEATLVYDTNVFSSIQFVAVSNWDTPIYNIANGKFASVRSDATCSNETQNVAIIKLTVKDNVTVGTTNISLTNIASSNGESTISSSNTSTTLNIVTNNSNTPSSDSNSNNNNNNSNNNNSTNNNNNNNNQNNSSNINNNNQNNSSNINNNTSNNSSSSNSNLPQTGEYDFIIIFAILLFTIICVYSFVNYKKYNNIF